MRSAVVCRQREPYGQQRLAGSQNGEDRGTPHLPVGDGQLDWRQFDMVARAIEKFEDYLDSTTGEDNRGFARKHSLRGDRFNARPTPVDAADAGIPAAAPERETVASTGPEPCT